MHRNKLLCLLFISVTYAVALFICIEQYVVTEREYSSVVEQSAAVRQVHGSTPCAPYTGHSFSSHQYTRVAMGTAKYSKFYAPLIHICIVRPDANLVCKLNQKPLLSVFQSVQRETWTVQPQCFWSFLPFGPLLFLPKSVNVTWSHRFTLESFATGSQRVQIRYSIAANE